MFLFIGERLENRGSFLFSSLVPLSGFFSFIYVIIYFIGCIIWEVPLRIFHLHLLKKNHMQFFAVGKKPMLLQYI